MQTDFRLVLKERTQIDHDGVDSLLSTFDITTQDGLARFLAVHLTCFAAMERVAPDGSEARAALGDMMRCIARDLETLNVPQPAEPVPVLPPMSVLAIDYMIEGSRLGTKMLKRIWLDSADPAVREASAYFTMPTIPGRWREVCAALSNVAVSGDEARNITEDTRTLFALFHDVASGETRATTAQSAMSS